MGTVITVKGLRKAYGDLQAVDGVDITVQSGQVFGLLGANGAGKTTTIECILGVKTADQGTIDVLGVNPQLRSKELFEEVGVQFQESSYQDKITVRELCEVTQALYAKPADYPALLEQFGLAGKHNSLVSELSGGLRQRLFVVLALIGNPRLVFLDELTTGLDTRVRRDVWKHLAALKERGLTIFLTSHYMDEVEALCDEICILKRGKIIFSGTVAEAVASSPYDRFEDAYLWYTDEEEGEE